LVFSRTDPEDSNNKVLVVANFNDKPQQLQTEPLKQHGFFLNGKMKDLGTDDHLIAKNSTATIPPLTYYWLID